MHHRYWLAFALLATCDLATAQERVWTSADGRTLRGEFVRELDGEVTLLVEGKLTTVPLDRLSDRDREIVRDLAAGKVVPDDPASPSSANPGVSEPVDRPPAASDPESPDRPAPLIKKPKAPISRIWTETQGRQYTGKFVRIFDGKVVLTRGGGPLSIPYFDLSAADQEYVKELLKSRGEEALIPTQPLPTGDGPSRGPRNPGAVGPLGPPGAARPGMVPAASGPPGSGPPRGMPMGPLESGGTAFSTSPPSAGDGVPSDYRSSGYAPGASSRPAEYLSEPQRRADSMASSAQLDADRMARAQQEQMDRTQSMFKNVPVCSACRSTLTDSEAQGSQCPRCGARWAFNLHTGSSAPAAAAASSQSSPTFNSTPSSTRSSSKWEFLDDPKNKRALYGGIAVIVVLAVVVAIIIGVLAVAFAVASASRAGRQYNDSGRL